jgi:hypothetical protein
VGRDSGLIDSELWSLQGVLEGKVGRRSRRYPDRATEHIDIDESGLTFPDLFELGVVVERHGESGEYAEQG